MSAQNMSGTLLVTISIMAYVFTSLLFSPAWAKLPFRNDNDFALHRFSGKGARLLYLFRAFYVGGLVFTLVPAMLINGFVSYFEQLFPIVNQFGLILICLFVLATAQITRIHILLKTDKWLFLVVCLAFIISLIYLVLETDWQLVSLSFPITPQSPIQWTDSLLYLFVIWWSTKILDGSGQDAQRLFHAKSIKSAIWASLIPIGFSVLFFNGVFLMGYLSWPLSALDSRTEFWVLDVLQQLLPLPFYILLILSLFFLFTSTLSSLLDVGATYVVGGMKEWRGKEISRAAVQLYLSIVTVLLSFYFDSMESLFKYILGISAGVGPVFVLRWFIKRINAYTQLTAMIAAAVWFVFIDFSMPEEWYSSIETQFFLSAYAFKVISVTLLTTITWLVTLFFTDKDSNEKTEHFFSFLSEIRTFQSRRQFLFIALLSSVVGFTFLGLSYSVPIIFAYSGWLAGLFILVNGVLGFFLSKKIIDWIVKPRSEIGS